MPEAAVRSLSKGSGQAGWEGGLREGLGRGYQGQQEVDPHGLDPKRGLPSLKCLIYLPKVLTFPFTPHTSAPKLISKSQGLFCILQTLQPLPVSEKSH